MRLMPTPYIQGRAAACAALLSLCASSALHAQPLPGEAPSAPVGHGYLSVQIENDSLGSGADRDYTHGTEIAYVSEPCQHRWVSRVAHAIYLLPRDDVACRRDRVTFALGQAMYTPSDISQIPPDPTDRPYAGWLYFTSGIISEDYDDRDPLALRRFSFRGLRKVEMSLGVVGPASGAGATQRAFHNFIGATEPRGWGSQLSNEPALLVSYEYQWRYGVRLLPQLEFDATPHASATVGNVFTQGALGLTVRVGNNMLLDYGPARIRPSAPGSAFFQSRDGIGWYAFAGVEGRAVGRNIFLDGNTFTDSPSVDKRSYVGDFQYGVAFTLSRVRIAFTQIYRTKEFFGQEHSDNFGAISLSFGL